jgi:tubulin-specific chaperone D
VSHCEIEMCETGNETFLQESGEVLSCCSNIARNQDESDTHSKRICEIFNSYLEQASLLDPILPRVFADLTTSVLVRGMTCRQSVYTALYVAAKVRGPKHVVKLFPHDPVTFRFLVKFLIAAPASSISEEVPWECHYVLFLWLSAAMRVPFPLESIVADTTIVELFSSLCSALHAPGKVSEGAAMALSIFLVRKDAETFLNTFLTTCLHDAKRKGKANGVVSALARIFKVGQRERLLPYVQDILKILDDLVDMSQTSGMLLRVKLAQRIALVCLKERVCSWRYNRGARVLFGRKPLENIGNQAASDINQSSAQMTHSSSKSNDGHDGDGGDIAITAQQEDSVEQVVDALLIGLQHRDTIVRWSSAKGIGRICARLPKYHSEDVTGATIRLFSSPAVARADSSWHGGCLALAELARRGLILPQTSQFDALVRVIRTAAAFDIRRGAHSVGAHVRDAACYVVWALARAYESADVGPYASEIAETILPVALLDREVNCRRAASAALQECVGRLGERSIAEGIKLVTVVDYFALGDRGLSYTKLAPAVAEMASGMYFQCILTELWTGKLIHWDETVRELAAKGLAALVHVDRRDELVNVVIPKLLDVSVQRGDAVHRHGAVLGLGKLVLAIKSKLTISAIQRLQILPGSIQQKGYFRGRIGDLMRCATCALIASCAEARNGVYSPTGLGRVAADEAFSILELALGSGKEEINLAASRAFEQLCKHYVHDDPKWYTEVVDKVDRGTLQISRIELARGFALAAGAIGSCRASLIAFKSVRQALVHSKDIEVRRNAAQSLGRLNPVLDDDFTVDVLVALTCSMADYTVDDRGDVGSWVREAAMISASSIIRQALREAPHIINTLDSTCVGAVRGIVRQLCERINRTRDVACFSLAVLFGELSTGFHVEGSNLPECVRVLVAVREAVDLGIPSGIVLSWSSSFDVRHQMSFRDVSHVSRAVRNLLALDTVWESAFIGTLGGCGNVSGGGSESSTTRWALDCILNHVRGLADTSKGMSGVVNIMISCMGGSDERLVMPCMVAAEFLTRKGAFRHGSAPDMMRLVKAVRGTWNGRLRDVSRVVIAVGTLCAFAVAHYAEVGGVLSSSRPTKEHNSVVRRACLEALVVVLAGPVPRLRRITAEGLYVVLVDCCGGHEPRWWREPMICSDDVTRALDILADTAWERLSVPEARSVRNKFCDLLTVDTPRAPSTRASGL